MLDSQRRAAELRCLPAGRWTEGQTPPATFSPVHPNSAPRSALRTSRQPRLCFAWAAVCRGASWALLERELHEQRAACAISRCALGGRQECGCRDLGQFISMHPSPCCAQELQRETLLPGSWETKQ